MNLSRIVTVLSLLLQFGFSAWSQDDAAYKMPPKDIADMLLAKPTPAVSIDDKGEWMLLTETSLYPSVEELARPEMKIAGLRINPNNYAPSRQNFITGISLKNIAGGKQASIAGLPTPLYAGNVNWSPSGRKIAFTQTMADHVDLYVIDVATQKAMKVNKTFLNVVIGSYIWYDDQTLLYKAILKPASAAPKKPLMPKGPTTQENYGKASPRPTFQDMIKSPYDEMLFEFFATSQLIRNTGGIETKIGAPSIYLRMDVSPDKKYILTQTAHKPFSYLVPANGFPLAVQVADMSGKLVKQVAELPSSETAPGGNDNVQFAPRGFQWRDDEPSTLVWCMPLDSGLIKKNVEYHDAVYAQPAPFAAEPVELFKTKMRYRGITWGDKNVAIVSEGLTGKQLTQMDRFNPVTGDLEKLMSRNSTDAYSSPGFPVTAPNAMGRDVLLTIDEGNKLLFNNPIGSSPKGDLPFLLSYDIHTKKADTLWRCQDGYFESVVRVLDAKKLTLVTRKESEKEMPNYWLKNLRLRIADRQLTSFTNPYPQLDGVSKEKIKYKRADGVDLTGDLYLPKGYDAKKDGPLPVFIWAYPAEYNSAADAAQIRGSEHRFTLLNWGSPVFYVTQGYAVLNNAEMPIVATDKDKKPNDNFIDQLTMNAKAAISELSSRGVGDSTRVAVGGHSYGAFMTANLLAHTNLFKAGIARSGAYNRSLTPFGFQNEDRTYWEAPDLYTAMSPFSFADKIKTPILLIHGDADDNTGTYPIQSERMFNAIKGHGGTVKYISLPYEAHGYRGRENILHMLNEQFLWLEKYVKNGKNAKSELKGF
ncbi:MAG TPA: prolyl oligopeptidase family serine peptidase [Chitinophagaceae bacterium]|nr:prolyl oligopeptidase family serine peptidase [Chitinophagaceae bacterium]